jgi:hypothetical protein
MKIVVGATAAGHKGADASRWLTHAEALRAATPHDVDFCFIAEVQPDGLEPRLDATAARVRSLGGMVWRFMLDDGTDRIDSGTRLVRICEGRNLLTEFALRSGADWILYVDADIVVPPDVIVRLLEMNHRFCGFKVGRYGLSGVPVAGYDFPVQRYQNTAGAWFVHRSLFRFFRWLWDPDDGLTDDPATYRLIRDHLGIEQYNRCDVTGDHERLVPFERRAIDRSVRRHELAAHPIAAVIPVYFATAEHVAMTAAVLEQVFNESAGRVYVLDNGGCAPHVEEAAALFARWQAQEGERLRVLSAREKNIYEMWNVGWTSALAEFGDDVLVAFLNNDISFRPGLLDVLARAVLRNEIWATYPDPACRAADGVHLTGRTRATRGSKRHGGLTGHCFLIKGGIHTRGGLALFDERFRTWYGDDDFAFRVERHGYQIHCVEGLPCDHLNEATARHRPEVMAAREADRRLFVEMWGER